MEELEVAYIAGIFDGEGSVDYAQRMEKKKETRPKAYLTWRIRCEVSMTNKEVMEWIHKKVGIGSLNLNVKNIYLFFLNYNFRYLSTRIFYSC